MAGKRSNRKKGKKTSRKKRPKKTTTQQDYSPFLKYIMSRKKHVLDELSKLEYWEGKLIRVPVEHSSTKKIESNIVGINVVEKIKKIKQLPEPVKYSVAFIIFTLFTAFCAMIFLSAVFALGSLSEEDVPTINATTVNVSESVNVEKLIGEMLPEKTTSTTNPTTTSTTASTSSTTTTLELLVCERPYMRFGMGCCLDVNDNSICDDDELKTTTTTLSDYIRCNDDLECGKTRIEYKCVEKEAHRLTIDHFCLNAGTRASVCETNVVDDLVKICAVDEQCSLKDDSVECKKTWAANNLVTR